MKTFAVTPAVICFVLLCGMTLWAQSTPAIFYTDLDSGPNTGGENNNGAWITIYGKGFGGTQGTVLVGNQPAAAYNQWRDDRISFQPGAAAPAGATTIVVQRADTAISNQVAFTIRAGNIFFVSATGSDSNDGSFGAPWRTIVRAKNSIAAGDIAYIMPGVNQTGIDAYNASLAIRSAGAAGRPKALVAYPGASPTIGSVTGSFGIRAPNLGAHYDYWTLAGFSVRGKQAINLAAVSGWRVIANDLSCPNGNGPGACLSVTFGKRIRVLGDSIHDSGTLGASNQYHSLYFATDSNHIEAGWNVIANNYSCRGIQFLSSPLGWNSGFNQYDLSVHDNLIHGQVCDGINFATIDPSRGPVLAYNNIIYSVGLGPDPPNGPSNYSCIYSQGLTNNGNPGSGTAQIFNNTMYDCGPWGAVAGSGSVGAISVAGGSPQVQFVNNIIVTLPGETSVGSWIDPNLISGANNLFGSVDINGVPGPGSGPAQFANSINADPNFAGASIGDFHLLNGSPAIDGGTTPPISLTHDFDGNPRPLGATFDVGAYEAVPPVVPPPDFSISTTPDSQTITVAAGASYTTTVTPLNGFSSAVNLSAAVSGSPAGVTTAFSPPSVDWGSGSSTLNVTTTSATPAGTYTITINGSDGWSLSHATNLTLVVSLASPPNHWIDLSWDASTASGVVSFNVYRSTVSGGPYTNVGSSLGTSFTDNNNVNAGQTYFYVVTAVDAWGAESAFSNETGGTVSTP